MPHQTRPFIGINADFVPASKVTIAQARLHAGYVNAVVAAGGMPIILPPLGKDADVDPLLDRLDGLMLSGGQDMDSKRSGQGMHSAVQPMAALRDESDRNLIARAVARQMPLLAIGVGMQQLNVVRGGNLYLHLPEDLPRSLPHRDLSGEPHRHAIVLKPKTRMEEIFGGGEIVVNSMHHQAVRQLGEGLRVGAVAPDGVIEAIEAVDSAWFCVGVQWHPEAASASALDMQLFESFVQACLRQARPLSLAA
jgi:putative glutamine amidotransferase